MLNESLFKQCDIYENHNSDIFLDRLLLPCRRFRQNSNTVILSSIDLCSLGTHAYYYPIYIKCSYFSHRRLSQMTTLNYCGGILCPRIGSHICYYIKNAISYLKMKIRCKKLCINRLCRSLELCF